jgi:hypothetical protein
MADDEWEYMVRSTVVELGRVIEHGPMDEETARIIAADPLAGIESTLLRRRKAGPWEDEPLDTGKVVRCERHGTVSPDYCAQCRNLDRHRAQHDTA